MVSRHRSGVEIWNESEPQNMRETPLLSPWASHAQKMSHIRIIITVVLMNLAEWAENISLAFFNLLWVRARGQRPLCEGPQGSVLKNLYVFSICSGRALCLTDNLVWSS